MLTKPRAWIHQSILHPVPGALGSTPLSCSLDKGIKFLCSQAWIKVCNAAGCKVTQHKPFHMPKGSQSKYKWPKQASTASPKHTGQKAADQLLWPSQKQRVLGRDLKQIMQSSCGNLLQSHLYLTTLRNWPMVQKNKNVLY